MVVVIFSDVSLNLTNCSEDRGDDKTYVDFITVPDETTDSVPGMGTLVSSKTVRCIFELGFVELDITIAEMVVRPASEKYLYMFGSEAEENPVVVTYASGFWEKSYDMLEAE